VALALSGRLAGALALGAVATSLAGAPALAAPADGKIDNKTLAQATLSVPPMTRWSGCPSGTVKFTNSKASKPTGTLAVTSRVYANLDADAALETAVLLTCTTNDVSVGQVVALDRDAKGNIVTLGQVVGPRNGVATVTALQASGGTAIGAEVADLLTTRTGTVTPQRQIRSYGPDGPYDFKQVGGPTSFPDRGMPTDLELYSAGVATTNKGQQYIRFDVRNKGTNPALGFWLHLERFGTTTVNAAPPADCFVEPAMRGYGCDGGVLQPGAHRAFTFRISTGDRAPDLGAFVDLLGSNTDPNLANNKYVLGGKARR